MEKIEKLLKSINLSKLTKEEAEQITHPITTEEIWKSILRIKNNKSPGVDGLPGEYYKMLEKELMPLLRSIIMHSQKVFPLSRGLKPLLMLFTRMAKTQHSPCLIAPSVSYLLIRSYLLSSLQTEFKNTSGQTSFIAEKQGTDNVWKSSISKYKHKKRNTPSVLLSLDARKTFDRVD